MTYCLYSGFIDSLKGLSHLDAESVFFAPKAYAILREGEKTLRKTAVIIELY